MKKHTAFCPIFCCDHMAPKPIDASSWKAGDKVEWGGSAPHTPRSGTLLAVGPNICLVDEDKGAMVPVGTDSLKRPTPKRRKVSMHVWLYEGYSKGRFYCLEQSNVGSKKAVAGPVSVEFEVDDA